MINPVQRILGFGHRDIWSRNDEQPGGRDVIGYGRRIIVDKDTGEQRVIKYPIYPYSKPVVKMDDAVNIAGSPWNTYAEKVEQLKSLGASQAMITMAFKKANDARNRVRVHGRMR